MSLVPNLRHCPHWHKTSGNHPTPQINSRLIYQWSSYRGLLCRLRNMWGLHLTSILITSPDNTQFQSDLNIVFGQLNKWFTDNLLSWNSDKTYFIQFTNKITCTSDMQITYEDKHIRTSIETKFLGLFINNNLSWKTHN